jgi:hypothetical protein
MGNYRTETVDGMMEIRNYASEMVSEWMEIGFLITETGNYAILMK